jgi:hypothetical protein
MQELLSRLERRSFHPYCLRRNIVLPEDRLERKSVKLARAQSNTLCPEREPRLWDLIQSLAPEEGMRVLVNKNVKCEPHRDNNEGHSYIMFLGDYEGGELVFEGGPTLSERNVWHKIDGQMMHWNLPHTGDKYSVVLYRRKGL